MSALQRAHAVALAYALALGALGAPVLAHAQAVPPEAAPNMGRSVPASPLWWNQLDAQQQAQLAPLRDQWDRLPPQRQQKLAGNARRWAAMPPERQQQVHDRLQRWVQMSPEERREVRENAKAFRQMTPEQREKLREAFQRFQSLPPEQRRALREQWRNANPQQRWQWLHSGQPQPKRPPAH